MKTTNSEFIARAVDMSGEMIAFVPPPAASPARAQPAGWRPISSAPRDGRNLMLRFGEDGVSQGKFIPGLPHPWQFIDTNDGITWLVNYAVDGKGGPSHWQYMPSASHGGTVAQPQQSARRPMSVVEWLAAVFGVIGAMLLATKLPPGLGFGAFLASNYAWIIFARRLRMRGLLLQQAVFTITSLVGLWNWWLGPLLLGPSA